MYLGITESQTRSILEREMAATGLIGGSGLILFGGEFPLLPPYQQKLMKNEENAALPHGSGTDRSLSKEDMILIDAGGKWGGYVADITRVSIPIRGRQRI